MIFIPLKNKKTLFQTPRHHSRYKNGEQRLVRLEKSKWSILMNIQRRYVLTFSMSGKKVWCSWICVSCNGRDAPAILNTNSKRWIWNSCEFCNSSSNVYANLLHRTPLYSVTSSSSSFEFLSVFIKFPREYWVTPLSFSLIFRRHLVFLAYCQPGEISFLIFSLSLPCLFLFSLKI